MGGTVIKTEFVGPEGAKQSRARDMFSHPNLTFDPAPEGLLHKKDAYKVMEWTLRCAADFISPKKVPGENEEFECEDLAFTFRTLLRDTLHKKILEASPLDTEAFLRNLDKKFEKQYGPELSSDELLRRDDLRDAVKAALDAGLEENQIMILRHGISRLMNRR